MEVQWDQPLEVVYDNGDVFTPDESHGNYVSWIDGDGDRRRHFFKSDGRSNFSDNFRIRNKPAADVAPAPVEEWGPAIEVGGVRPAWLSEDSKVNFWNNAGVSGTRFPAGIAFHSGANVWVTHIRLPANHPHYRTETPAEAPLGVFTGVEALDKLEALTRRLAKGFHLPHVNDDGITPQEAVAEAQHIVRVYLKPEIDPDLLKAREIATAVSEIKRNYTDGKSDESMGVRAALAGIKAGRKMESGDA